MKRLERDFIQEHDREPEDKELAKLMKLPLEKNLCLIQKIF